MPMPEHFTDRLLEAIETKGAPVCIGIDPVAERLPKGLGVEPVEAIEDFSCVVLDAIAEFVPAVKVQLACFERYRAAGYAAFDRVVRRAASLGLIVIADAKRNDIATSATHYAAGLLEAADAVTVGTYLGRDSLEPFLNIAATEGKGLFALVRTSNPDGDALQSLQLADGRRVSEAVADLVADAGRLCRGTSGFSLLGAVVGATKAEEIASLRRRMPQQIFLIPGIGAQGAALGDILGSFDESGQGALVTASRSVIYAFDSSDKCPWARAVAGAARLLRDELAALLARRRDP